MLGMSGGVERVNLGKQCFVVLLMLSVSVTAYADTLSDYRAARDNYVEATACMAAYSGYYGAVSRAALQREGWTIRYFRVQQDPADAKFILMRRTDPATGQTNCLLAIAGTETDQDKAVDMRFGKVYFAGKTSNEFAANAAKDSVDNSQPKVHRGFQQVVQAVFSVDLQQGSSAIQLPDLLVRHPAQRIILTGHSLGGAVAVISGARLLRMGVRPDQIKVVTFGAPAPGNAAFAQSLSGKLEVTRFVANGDQITSVLQDLVGGYAQYGTLVPLQPPAEITIHPHSMAVYLDGVITRYLAVRRKAVAEGCGDPARRLSTGRGRQVYVAAINNSLPLELSGQFANMQTLLADEYCKKSPGCILGNETDLPTALRHASAQGCRQLVVAEIGGTKLKTTADAVFYITVQQQVFSVPGGRLLDTRDSSASTDQLTPLTALLYTAQQLTLP